MEQLPLLTPLPSMAAGMVPWIVGGLGLYWVALVWLPKRWYGQLQTIPAYFLGSQQLSAWPIAFTFVASWFGASSMKGSLEAYLKEGLSAVWVLAVPSLLSTLLIAVFLAKKVAVQPELSQPEAVERHYGSRARFLLSWVILAASTTFLASQAVAAGQLLGQLLGWPMEWACALMFAGVVSYSALGGYIAVVMTDIAQLVLIVLSLLLLLGQGVVTALNHPAYFSQLPPSYWHWLPAKNPLDAVALAIAFALGWCIAPEMWQRMRSAPSAAVAGKAAFRGVGLLWSLLAMVLAIGLLSGPLLGEANPLANAPISTQGGLLGLAFSLPHPALTTLVVLGFLAAVGSSMDSTLNVGSFVLTHDLFKRYVRPQASNKTLLRVSRLATVAMALPAFAIATRFQDLIHVLWLSADIYACSMVWPIVGLLWDTNAPVKHKAGLTAMVVGASMACLTALVQYGVLAWPWYPKGGWATLLGVGLSGLAYGVGRGFNKPVVSLTERSAR